MTHKSYNVERAGKSIEDTDSYRQRENEKKKHVLRVEGEKNERAEQRTPLLVPYTRIALESIRKYIYKKILEYICTFIIHDKNIY